MPTFHYRAARPNGATLEAQIEGADERAVRGELERQGLIVLNLRNEAQTFSGRRSANWFRARISQQEFLVFNQELLALLKAGLPVLQVWDLLIEQSESASFKDTLRAIREDIRAGSAASEAMGRHPKMFPDLYVATIRAGEQSGNLSVVLQRYVQYLKLMIGLRQKVTKALAYPAFLIIIGVAVVGFLLTYVMPTFVSVYGESSMMLPPATQALLSLIEVLQSHFILMVCGVGLFCVAIRSYRATAEGRYATDRLLVRIPTLGTVFVQHNTVQIAQTLATVLAGGIPLVDALKAAGGAVSNRYIAQGVSSAVDRVREGVSLAVALEQQAVLPRLATAMITVGEQTGELEAMLRDIGEFYEGSLDLKLTQLTTWIEPVLLLIMGLLVGTIVIIMYLPVFQMAGTIQ